MPVSLQPSGSGPILSSAGKRVLLATGQQDAEERGRSGGCSAVGSRSRCWMGLPVCCSGCQTLPGNPQAGGRNNLQSSLNWYILSLIRTCSSRDSVLRFRGVVKTSFLECWSYLSSVRTASSFKIRYLPYYISTLLVSELSTFGCKTAC